QEPGPGRVGGDVGARQGREEDLALFGVGQELGTWRHGGSKGTDRAWSPAARSAGRRLSHPSALVRQVHGAYEKGVAMNVFVAGATGALGKQLVPRLVAHGHDVVGMTRTE